MSSSGQNAFLEAFTRWKGTCAEGRPIATDVISVRFLKSVCEWCCETTLFCVHCWPENVRQASLWLYHCFPLLFELFICTLYVLDAGAWHIQTFESSTGGTTPKKIQCGASLDTSWHDHLIKVLSKCRDKCTWGDMHKRKCAYILYTYAHTHRHTWIYTVNTHIYINTYKNTYKNMYKNTYTGA